jgi:hypothetical protein
MGGQSLEIQSETDSRSVFTSFTTLAFVFEVDGSFLVAEERIGRN